MMRLFPVFLLCLVSLTAVNAQHEGSRMTFNDGWSFTKQAIDPSLTVQRDAVRWVPIRLPHSWNIEDLVDDEAGYHRGECWYRKRMSFRREADLQTYLQFGAANQVARVFVNGQLVYRHTGGYTAFRFRVDPLLHEGDDNEILIGVDNSYNAQVPPLTADFSFIGGLYRDAEIITVNGIHFDLDDHGSDGVFVNTVLDSPGSATVKIRAGITSPAMFRQKQAVNIDARLFDRYGESVAVGRSKSVLQAGISTRISLAIANIKNPHLWSPADPYLYSCVVTITDPTTKVVLDRRVTPVGFRWFRFDANDGFFLNGKSLKLVGASRHQDRAGLGNAVPSSLAVRDVELLKEMGGNFLRVAHYPQDQAVLEACDRLGIIASVEIPVVNEITGSDSFYLNCLNMEREMIRQNYNHPAVVMWCYMNEVLLRPHFNNDKPRQQVYFANISALARRLDSLAHAEDPARVTMIANHGDFNRYRDVGLTAIPDVVGWNLYSGWYGGELKNFAEFLDRHHRELAGKPLMVTEYGADADPRIHSSSPVRFDKSVEYALSFHRYYLEEMLSRPFVLGAVAWNLADFNSETREETMPHINNKGLLGWDRRPKDLYYYYKAMLSGEPFVKIGWIPTTALADGPDGTYHQPVNVFSNLDSVELISNGHSSGRQRVKQGSALFTVSLVNGANRFTAMAGSAEDARQLDVSLVPLHTDSSFTSINILCGAGRSFIDETDGRTYIPDHPYAPGGWGSIGGRPFKVKGNTRLPYGTDKNILGTDADPIYQTQLMGLQGYRFDVPAGYYEVTLHFAELEGLAGKELAYNLSANATPTAGDSLKQRVFNVSINNQQILSSLDLAKQYGAARAVSFTFRVYTQSGILLRFDSVIGETVLNAIQLRRL